MNQGQSCLEQERAAVLLATCPGSCSEQDGSGNSSSYSPQGLVSPSNLRPPSPPPHRQQLLSSLIIIQDRWKREVGNWRVESSFLESQKNDCACEMPHLENKVDVLTQPGALLNLWGRDRETDHFSLSVTNTVSSKLNCQDSRINPPDLFSQQGQRTDRFSSRNNVCSR